MPQGAEKAKRENKPVHGNANPAQQLSNYAAVISCPAAASESMSTLTTRGRPSRIPGATRIYDSWPQSAMTMGTLVLPLDEPMPSSFSTVSRPLITLPNLHTRHTVVVLNLKSQVRHTVVALNLKDLRGIPTNRRCYGRACDTDRLSYTTVNC